jgi:hypothetical protein
VQAQMYKCTEGGKTRYSDKPITDCKSATTITVPTPPATAPAKGPPPFAKSKKVLPHAKASAKKQDKKGASVPPREAAKAPPTEHDKKYASARCGELKEEQTWLRSARGAKVERRDERLAQVQQALAACR